MPAVLLHAREVFGARGDLTTALRSLADQGLVGVQPGPAEAGLVPS